MFRLKGEKLVGTDNKNKPCQYALVYEKVEDILNQDDIISSFKPQAKNWNESWTYYQRFYKVSRVDLIDIPMEEIVNLDDEDITARGKLRPGIIVKYIGKDPRLEYLNS
ncbi:MAG: hypothetical protein ACOC4M_17840 [Promethearchaeia archaeon]